MTPLTVLPLEPDFPNDEDRDPVEEYDTYQTLLGVVQPSPDGGSVTRREQTALLEGRRN